ncbi:MAG: hypothetical protein GVY06_03640 [Alphaproteobacteria bacterium]|jgi:hypothetical protein|nr:hypothetical protein [Alphaproteobacteria bacterium]
MFLIERTSKMIRPTAIVGTRSLSNWLYRLGLKGVPILLVACAQAEEAPRNTPSAVTEILLDVDRHEVDGRHVFIGPKVENYKPLELGFRNDNYVIRLDTACDGFDVSVQVEVPDDRTDYWQTSATLRIAGEDVGTYSGADVSLPLGEIGAPVSYPLAPLMNGVQGFSVTRSTCHNLDGEAGVSFEAILTRTVRRQRDYVAVSSERWVATYTLGQNELRRLELYSLDGEVKSFRSEKGISNCESHLWPCDDETRIGLLRPIWDEAIE